MSRSYVATDLDARLTPYMRRIGVIAREHEYVVINLVVKHHMQRLGAVKSLGIVDPFHEISRQLIVAAAGSVITELRPTLAFAGGAGFSFVFPPVAKDAGRMYSGRTNPLLSGAASLAAVALLTEASTVYPEYVKAFPNEALQINGHTFTLPTPDLAEDWAVREELVHEKQVVMALAHQAGIQTGGVPLTKVRALLERTSQRWMGMSRSARLGTVLKPLPSSEASVWDSLEMPDSFPALRDLVEEGKLRSFIEQCYGREARQQVQEGIVPPIP